MNMRYLNILPIFSFFLGIGGYQLYNSLFEEEEQTIRTAVSYDEIARLEENIVKNGDIDSYNQLMSYHLDQIKPINEFVIYSMIMANKYNYPQACWDVYWRLVYLKDSVDSQTLNIGMSFLQHGVELNSSSCMNELGQLYLDGKYVDRNEPLGNELLNKAEIIRKGKTNE
jgi:hypothetical protein